MKADTATRPFRYRPFGILRFVLALMVLAQHFYSDIAPDTIKQILFPFAMGNVAVLGFFILSGFIVCEAYTHNYQGRPVSYLKNRFMRIFPGYWAALILSIFVHFFIAHSHGFATSLDRHTINSVYFSGKNLLLNFMAIMPPVQLNMTDTTNPFIPYAWALQTEMMFYLTIFFIGLGTPFLHRTTKQTQNFWFAATGYAGIVAATLTQFHWLPKQLAYGSYFAFGGALFFLLHGHKKSLWVLLPALVQMAWHFSDYAAEDFTVIAANRVGQFMLLTGIIIAIITLAITQAKDTKIDKIFGELSYPLYLNHYVIGIIVLNSVDYFSATYLLWALGASLVLTVLMFLGVDQPLVKIRRSIRKNDV